MNFGLSKKYSEIDFEDVGIAELLVIGGGCGGGGGMWSVQSVQAAAQSAAAAVGISGPASVTVGPGVSGGVSVGFSYGTGVSGGGSVGGSVTGTARVDSTTGQVTITSTPNGGIWVSVSGFFSWLFSFGSH